MSAATQVASFPYIGLALLAIALLFVGLVVSVIRYERAPSRNAAVPVIAVAVGLSLIGAAYAYGAYAAYVRENTWAFDYLLDIQGNGTAPESLVVPIVKDESLFAKLHLASGTANWSFVDTPQGRGLFVRFTGSAQVAASVSMTPRPAVFPDTSPTMVVTSNCTVMPSNCTGRSEVWVFYSGPSGARLYLSIDSWTVYRYLAVGWTSYNLFPPPVT